MLECRKVAWEKRPVMSERRLLVFTGMHRSHTSLLGSLFERAGLPFCGDLVGANSSNPFGHFEDVAILQLQKAILKDNGAKWFRGIDRPLVVSDARRAELSQLIARRFEELGPVWGFKTPHSSLLLDDLASFSEARFVFSYRAPRPVLSSLLRRMGRQLYWRPDAPLCFARAYAVYNERIAAFAEAHPDRCHVLSSDELLAEPKAVLDTVSCRFALELADSGSAVEVVRPDTISAQGHFLERRLSGWLSALPRVRRAYERMQTLGLVQSGAPRRS